MANTFASILIIKITYCDVETKGRTDFHNPAHHHISFCVIQAEHA